METNDYKRGLKDGIPIALGYLGVSFAFGITAVGGGLSVFEAVFISMSNLTSAGQLAGLNVMLTTASMAEMALTQLVINLRYALMSLSLSQKLNENVTKPKRAAIAFFNTDEIFALAANQKNVSAKYMFGLGTLPYFGWAGGTLLGSLAGGMLPSALTDALNIAIYGMFISLIVPSAKKDRGVLFVCALATVQSVIIYHFFKFISFGTSVIICAVISAAVAAAIFPIKEDN